MKAPSVWGTPAQVDLEAVVTRREVSLFAQDMAVHHDRIVAALEGKRIMIVGGGGSIGAATTGLMLDYRPAALHVVDQSENYLAELTRDLRGQNRDLSGIDLRTLPLDYGGGAMARFLRESAPYDVVLNFAALKHVRSEKDVYSILQMIDTNIVRHIRFKNWLDEGGHFGAYFAVSTDKAANPVSVMGASKRLMEDVVFDIAAERAAATTSARFANVAFSNGSLLEGVLRRLEKRQPVAVPRDTARYFISSREAGELCVLAAVATPDGHIAIPRLEPRTELQPLQNVVARVLEGLGLVPEFLDDEARARREVERLVSRGRWPVLLTPLDTTGEKRYEEFVGEDESQTDIGGLAYAAVRHHPTGALESDLIDRLAVLINDASASVEKSDIVAWLKASLKNFNHLETGRYLDQRL